MIDGDSVATGGHNWYTQDNVLRTQDLGVLDPGLMLRILLASKISDREADPSSSALGCSLDPNRDSFRVEDNVRSFGATPSTRSTNFVYLLKKNCVRDMGNTATVDVSGCPMSDR